LLPEHAAAAEAVVEMPLQFPVAIEERCEQTRRVRKLRVTLPKPLKSA